MKTEEICHGDTFSKRATFDVPQSNKILTHRFRFDLIIHAEVTFKMPLSATMVGCNFIHEGFF